MAEGAENLHRHDGRGFLQCVGYRLQDHLRGNRHVDVHQQLGDFLVILGRGPDEQLAFVRGRDFGVAGGVPNQARGVRGADFLEGIEDRLGLFGDYGGAVEPTAPREVTSAGV